MQFRWRWLATCYGSGFSFTRKEWLLCRHRLRRIHSPNHRLTLRHSTGWWRDWFYLAASHVRWNCPGRRFLLLFLLREGSVWTVPFRSNPTRHHFRLFSLHRLRRPLKPESPPMHPLRATYLPCLRLHTPLRIRAWFLYHGKPALLHKRFFYLLSTYILKVVANFAAADSMPIYTVLSCKFALGVSDTATDARTDASADLLALGAKHWVRRFFYLGWENGCGCLQSFLCDWGLFFLGVVQIEVLYFDLLRHQVWECILIYAPMVHIWHLQFVH